MWHRHIPFTAILLAALFSIAAEKSKKPAPSTEQIQTWVKQLGDKDFKVREVATQDLIKAGGVAFNAVAKSTRSEDPEVKQRALKIIDQYQEYSQVFVKRGLAWLKLLDESERAIEDFSEAIRLAPKDARTFMFRGDAHTDTVFNEDEAIDDYTEAIRLNPNDATIFWTRGDAWTTVGEYDKATSDYTEAIRLNPKDARFFSARGNARRNSDEAIADYTEAIRLNPKDARNFRDRGWSWHSKARLLLHDKGEYNNAIADYTEAIRLNPNDVGSFRLRGYAWKEISDKAKAKGDSGKAKELWTKSKSDLKKYENLFQLSLSERQFKEAVAYTNRARYDKAIDHYTQAIRRNQKFAQAYKWRGFVWEKKGKYDKAIADYSEAIRLNPKYAIAYYSRARTWRRKGDKTKAEADYKKATKLDLTLWQTDSSTKEKGTLPKPDSDEAYYKQGRTWSNEYDKAIAGYFETIRLNPKDDKAFLGRGVSWTNKSEYNKAISDFNEAIRLNPKYAEAYFFRGAISEKRGDKRKSKADFRNAKELWMDQITVDN